MRISRSRYQTFHDCPRKYYWLYCQGIDAIRAAPALRVGAAGHVFLEYWHKFKTMTESLAAMEADFSRTLNSVVMAPMSQEYEDSLKSQAELSCRGYASMYGDPAQDKNFQVVGTELADSVDLPRGHLYDFRIDCLVMCNDALWVGEHKFLKDIGPGTVSSFYFDHQCIMYVWAAGVIVKQTIKGVLMNLIRKPTKQWSVAFHREPVPITAQHIRNAVESFAMTCEDIERRDPGNIHDWPQVTGHCASCQYFNICAFDAEPGPPAFVPRSISPSEKARLSMTGVV